MHLSGLLKPVRLSLPKPGHSTRSKSAVLLPVGAFPGFGSQLVLQGPAPASLINVRSFLVGEGRECSPWPHAHLPSTRV